MILITTKSTQSSSHYGNGFIRVDVRKYDWSLQYLFFLYDVIKFLLTHFVMHIAASCNKREIETIVNKGRTKRLYSMGG